MFKDALRAVAGIEIFPVIALIIFFISFLLVVIWVVRLDGKIISEMESLPFEDNMYDGDE